jgi:acetyl-CoA acetyltransferase
MPPPSRELSRKAAIVGIGETDYGADYKAERAKAAGYEAPTVEKLSLTAFERALSDSGMKREDIDGLALSFTFGGPDPKDMAKLLGIEPRYCIANGNIMAGPLPVVCAAIAAGEVDTVAMVFAVASRTLGRDFGGKDEFTGEGVPPSYYYYHPWGWSSQAAHWAMIFSHYQGVYGVREEDLGSVAIQLRRNAMDYPSAVMQTPMTIESYMASRYIVRPLHLFDICLVNDGAVCLIVSRHDLARERPHKPVLVAGWGESKIKHSKLSVMVRERLRPQMQEAGRQALDMAGLSVAEIQHFEGYDASTIHLIDQVEGFGFTEPGTGIHFCKDGQMAVGGRLPTNTAGGNLSGSYMQGWGHVAEVVRQLRHEAGPRQIPNAQVSMSAVVQTDQAHPLVFVRGE